MSIENLIIALCGLGLGVSCWRGGLKSGAERTIEILHTNKIICYDNNGDIKPNLFWQEDDKEED
jgi:hypothetical protein